MTHRARVYIKRTRLIIYLLSMTMLIIGGEISVIENRNYEQQSTGSCFLNKSTSDLRHPLSSQISPSLPLFIASLCATHSHCHFTIPIKTQSLIAVMLWTHVYITRITDQYNEDDDLWIAFVGKRRAIFFFFFSEYRKGIEDRR